MTAVAFGRLACLIRDRTHSMQFQVGLEAIESTTGRMLPVDGSYEGQGVAFRAGDVLFGKLRPYLAKSWLADRAGSAVGDFHVYRADTERALPAYLRYVTLSRAFLGPIEASVQGAKMPRADWETVRGLPVWAPSLCEQRAIADYLDRETAQIDALIAKQEQLIATLRERRFAVLSLVFGQPPHRSMDWRETLASAWRVARVKHVATLHAGGTPSTENQLLWSDSGEINSVPWVSISDMSRHDFVSMTSRSLSSAGVDAARLVTAQPGTVLLAMYASVGEVAVLTIEACWNQAIVGLAPHPHLIDSAFLATALRATRHELLRDVRSNTQSNLNAFQVANLEIPLPPLDEQRRIVAELDEQTAKIDTLIEKAQIFIALAKERRAALITAAVTGQLAVPGLDAPPSVATRPAGSGDEAEEAA